MNNRKKVFLVEDDEEIRNAYTYLINISTEFECTGFQSAENLLNAIKFDKPDIVLMDVNLPVMNGIECTKIIKSNYPEILVVMFTVYENNENIFEALRAGASGYILKRSSPDKILAGIREVSEGGAPMSESIARKVVSSFNSTADTGKKGDYGLSPREVEVLQLLAMGFRYKDIAEKLFISISTVSTHIYSIYEKLHVHNRTEALNKFKG